MVQFCACKFRPTDKRAYTYRNDGEPVAVGDIVKVEDKSGDGWQKVEVAEILAAPPPFQCKPILGRYEPPTGKELDEALLQMPPAEPHKPTLPLGEPANPFDEYVEAERSGLAGPSMFDREEGIG